MSTPNLDEALCVRPLSEVAPRDIAWLWPGRLALGKLALLEGDPGLGKSLVTLDLCARLSTGRPFPDDSPSPGCANAIIINGEDNAADTIRPRLQTLGADLARLFIWEQQDGTLSPLHIPSQLQGLDRALERTHARLVAIDPISAFLDPHIAIHSESAVRRALLPLMQLAERYECAILLHRHLNKSGGRHALYRGGGSIAFVAACRSAWLIAPDPQHPEQRVLAQVKNNLTVPQPSLAYSVERQEDGTPRLCWLGSRTWRADQLLARGTPPRPRARTRAREFLAEFLKAGPCTSQTLWAEAQKRHLAARTVLRAKRELAIRCIRICLEGRRLTYWLLPGQELPASVPPDAAPPDLEPWLAHLRERFPPSTPLDEDDRVTR